MKKSEFLDEFTNYINNNPYIDIFLLSNMKLYSFQDLKIKRSES